MSKTILIPLLLSFVVACSGSSSSSSKDNINTDIKLINLGALTFEYITREYIQLDWPEGSEIS